MSVAGFIFCKLVNIRNTNTPSNYSLCTSGSTNIGGNSCINGCLSVANNSTFTGISNTGTFNNVGSFINEGNLCITGSDSKIYGDLSGLSACASMDSSGCIISDTYGNSLTYNNTNTLCMINNNGDCISSINLCVSDYNQTPVLDGTTSTCVGNVLGTDLTITFPAPQSAASNSTGYYSAASAYNDNRLCIDGNLCTVNTLGGMNFCISSGDASTGTSPALWLNGVKIGDVGAGSGGDSSTAQCLSCSFICFGTNCIWIS